jgi:hypothetical protein
MIASKLWTDRAMPCGLLLTCLLILPAALSGSSGQAGLPAQMAQADSKSPPEPSDALRRLLLERYRVLKDAVAQLQVSAEQGREGTASLRDFTIAMFHAEADLAGNAAERVKVYERLVEFVSSYGSHIERLAAAGRATGVDVAKTKVLVLDAQIELERQRLAE